MPPKKKSSITDIALRLLFADLIDRGQTTPGNLGRVLGYPSSTEVRKFLRNDINFSRLRMASTIETLVNVYGANKTFLETGHGNMYAGKPYMNEDEPASFTDTDNITSYANRQRISELEESLKKLQERNKQLEELLKAKNETIQLQNETIKLQKDIIEVSGFPGTRG
jgi:hypothetical protein